MKTISQICKFLSLGTENVSKCHIHSLSLDSRKCDSKTVFIALEGQSSNGNNYIKNVLEKGVKLVLSDNAESTNSENIFFVKNLKDSLSNLAQWFYDYQKPQSVIGVTGTNGKTSISSYIAQLLDFQNEQSLLLGTNGNGIYPNLEESSHTTLDVLSLYAKLGQFDDEFENLVMEVSSHSLDQNRTAGLEFDVAIFSNISHDHLDYHRTMENYFLAKAKLFEKSNLRKAVINIDDEYGKKLCDISTAKELVKVSLLDENADICIKKKKITSKFTYFDIFTNGENLGEYKTKLIGEFNLMNLALSLGAVDNFQDALGSVDNVEPVKGRMERISLKSGATVIIDYAHTPDALEKVLQTLQEYKENQLWCMFGCGGNRDKTKRPIMAEVAERNADLIIVTEDNSRHEAVMDIFLDIKEGFESEHIFIPSRDMAIKQIVENAQAGDIALLAGKGHECYLDVNGQKIHFDEREIIAKYDI